MAETRDFLLEIGTEEMPSAPLMNAAQQLARCVQRQRRLLFFHGFHRFHPFVSV